MQSRKAEHLYPALTSTNINLPRAKYFIETTCHYEIPSKTRLPFLRFLPRLCDMAPGLRSLLQAGSTHGQQEIDAESLLAELCTPPRSSSSGKTSRISSEKFVEIAALLEGIGGLAWSIRPRTYTVLRNIARLDLLDHFASQGLTDFDLPYSERTLPDFINERSIRKQFLIDQQYVLTDARLFEEPGGAHISIDGYAKQYFYFKRHLGQGGFGLVT